MKAITIIEPWASLLVFGPKQYETRTWPTSYRGPLAIHAGKSKAGLKLMRSAAGIILGHEAEKLNIDFEATFGHIIGIIELADCIEMTPSFINSQNIIERGLGGWEPGRYAWKKSSARAIEPVPARGMQRLWEWEADNIRFKGE